MKKFSLLLLVSIVVLASACKKDDPVTPEPTKEELIVGDWNLESMASNDGIVLFTLDSADTDTSTFTIQSKNENYRLELNENKSFNSSGQMTIVTTSTKSDDEVNIEEKVTDTTSTGTWVIDGDYLVISTSNSEATKNKIIELTADKLKIETIERDTFHNKNPTGTIDIISSNTTISTFKK